ncbi:MAG: PKD domain-containing protein, partial [Ignavibacteriae bacterium]|nr:PKD domain-containing protein [Ignavibacteriota bacterium]
LSKTNATVNESITFDAAASYDNDGQIVSYLWNFGDGESSTQKTATHSYSTANTFDFSLKVTDDKGGTNTTSGQVTILGSTNQYVIVSPASGSIEPGGSQKITLTLDAQSILEGTYTGQVKISTNGGTINIPIDYLVDIKKISSVPENFSLSQNYPNPFNPSTVIEFTIPNSKKVKLKVFDALGKEVVNLVDEYKSSGKYSVNFDASNMASGIYFYRLETDGYIQTRKMLLLK